MSNIQISAVYEYQVTKKMAGRGAALLAPAMPLLLLSILVLFSSPLCHSSSLIPSPFAPAAAPLRPSSAPRAEVAGLRLRGGGLPYRYTDGWNEVTVRMPIAENIKARDIVYALTP